MNFPLTAYGDLQFRLLLIAPNWESMPIVTHRADTTIAEGRTTIEERRPARAAFLLKQRVQLTLLDSDADDWRKGMAALGNGLVAMPLWVDALPVADWATRIYDPQKVINFDPATGSFQIYDAALPPDPAYPLYAPLMLGRWGQRPPAGALTGEIADVQVELVEASPWDWRIGVNGYGTGWVETPDWTSPVKDASDFGLEQIQLSAAREPGLDRVNAAQRWTQEGMFTFEDRLAIRTALTVFAAKRGSWATWSPVPAWFQPGAGTADTPDNYTARFASDSLALTYISGSIATAKIGFIQEIDTPTINQSQPGEVYLYRLVYDPDPANPELFTNWDAPLTAAEGTYQPRQIAHQEIVRSLKPQDEKTEIQMDYVAGSLAADWILARLFGIVRVTVWKCDPDDPPGTRGNPIFSGVIDEVRPEGNTLTVVASLFGSLLGRRVPGWAFARNCNTFVFSGLCTLDEAAHRSTGTAAAADLSADGATLTVHGAAGFGGADYADGFFASGILRTGTGRKTIVVTIIASSMSGADLILKFRRPLPADYFAAGGQAVTLVPGCMGQYDSDCGTKYNNQANFRGFPFIPDYIETRDSGSPQSPKK